MTIADSVRLRHCGPADLGGNDGCGLTGAKTTAYVLDDSGNRNKNAWPDGYYVRHCYNTYRNSGQFLS